MRLAYYFSVLCTVCLLWGLLACLPVPIYAIHEEIQNPTGNLIKVCPFVIDEVIVLVIVEANND